jgi:hypothetical protein
MNRAKALLVLSILMPAAILLSGVGASGQPAGGKIGALAAADSDAASAAAAAAAAAALNPEERALAEALAEGPVSLDDLLRRTGLPTGKAASAMTMLTLKGVVAQRAGNVFELKRNRPGASRAE